MHEHHKEIAVLYHGGCPDGFGGAYAAWKKFGDAAEYIPVKYGNPIPEGLTGRDVYLIDFCYDDKAQMDEIARIAKSITVLDHHKGAEEVIRSFPGVFAEDHSGATIAWSYFHPNTPTPRLILLLEDDDLYRFALPETRALNAYLAVLPHHFEKWDALAQKLDDPETRAVLVKEFDIYLTYFELLAAHAAAQAKVVQFEGHECFFANAHPFISMRSRVGRLLVEQKPPLALLVSAHPEGYGVSLRSDGSVDVAAIAKKYGGDGHPQSAGFAIAWGQPLPWTLVEKKHEHPRN